jgi:hypothetical protein
MANIRGWTSLAQGAEEGVAQETKSYAGSSYNRRSRRGVQITFDALRSAMGLLKDAKELLPPGDQRQQAITQALATAESSSKIAEAEVAKALGFELCKCQFPPTPMLTVGYFSIQVAKHLTGDPVFECPKCGINNAGPFRFQRTVPERQT